MKTNFSDLVKLGDEVSFKALNRELKEKQLMVTERDFIDIDNQQKPYRETSDDLWNCVNFRPDCAKALSDIFSKFGRDPLSDIIRKTIDWPEDFW